MQGPFDEENAKRKESRVRNIGIDIVNETTRLGSTLDEAVEVAATSSEVRHNLLTIRSLLTHYIERIDGLPKPAPEPARRVPFSKKTLRSRPKANGFIQRGRQELANLAAMRDEPFRQYR